MSNSCKNCSYFFAGILILLLLCSRCANTQTGPSGGPTDSIPPVLLKTTPPQNSTNFNAKKIVLTFDENMKVKDVSKNVVLSPPTLLRPTIVRRGKTVQITFQDTLESNRTYNIDFGSAIVDNNEDNPFPPYRYVFSTGNYIDTFAFTGMVRDAYTLESIPTATIMLYENLSDTAIYKTLPVAVARTDEWGYFSLQNIAPRTYRMIAIEDKNSNYRYDVGSEPIAFLDTLLIPQTTVAMLPPAPDLKDTAALLTRPYEHLLLSSQENVRKQFLVESPLLGKRQFRLVFNQYNPTILSLNINGVDSTEYVIERSRFSDTLVYWITTPTLPDTLYGTINYLKTDSLDQLSPTEANLKFIPLATDKEKKEEEKDKDAPKEIPKLQPKINFNQQTGMDNGVVVSFEELPVKIDTTKLTLFKVNDDKRIKQLLRWKRDTSSLRQFYVQSKWETNSNYELEILPEAFTGIYGLSNDTIVQKIITPNPDKYCHLTLNLTNISSPHIVQILNVKKDRVLREILVDKAGKIVFSYLQSGEYCVRFINDENRNGVWDPANVADKKQPEKVAFLKLADNSTILVLKENFDITQDVDIEIIFAPEKRPSLHLHDEKEEHEHDHDHNHEHHDHN